MRSMLCPFCHKEYRVIEPSGDGIFQPWLSAHNCSPGVCCLGSCQTVSTLEQIEPAATQPPPSIKIG